MQPAPRIIDDSLDGINQAVPFEGRDGGVAILDPFHKMHPAVVQTLVVDDEPARLVTQQLHHVVRGVHEHKHVAAVQVLPHMVVHDAAQHVEVLPHVRWLRVQPELRSVSKAEHTLHAFKDCVHHRGSQAALDAHVRAGHRAQLNTHPVLSGWIRLGLPMRVTSTGCH